MKVFYSELKQEIKAQDPIIVLARNNHWFLWGIGQKSRNFGYWVKDKERIFKLIDSFEIPGLSFFDEVKKIEIISPHFAKIYFKGNILEIFLDSQGLILKSNKPLQVKINLDFRKLNSMEKFGNNYQILPLSKGYFINFFQAKEKYNIDAYLFYEGDLKFKNYWKEIYSNFDEQRNSLSSKNWTYEALEGYFTEIKIFYPNKLASIIPINSHFESEIVNFLFNRIVSLYDNYFSSGLPWFCEYWFRDELISLWLMDDLCKSNKIFTEIKKKLINDYLENLENFALSNKPCGENSADTLLWILMLLDKKQINKYSVKIKEVFEQWLKCYFKNEKLLLPEKSTWMDTLNRPRALEIDFLLVKVMEKLDDYKNITEVYSKKIKNYLVTEFYPKAELESPNLFLTYLIKPDIVSVQKWERLFEKLINKNWCKWGGFSTLSKNNSNFHLKHTGENPSSYHQGDSWFWLNNIAGVAMKKLNQEKYQKYINQIVVASLKNMLNLGALGWGSELSSANELKSEGSPVQLWSMASLLRLIVE